MKKIWMFFTVLSLMTACNKKENNAQESNVAEATDTLSYQSFGEVITSEKALSKEEMLAKYESMQPGDTLSVKFASEIKKTCKKKGCWMTLDLSNDKQAFIKFKDYAFFVPKERAEEHKTIDSAKAFVSATTVAELKRYAKHAGIPYEQVEEISESKVVECSIADGVLNAGSNE